MTVGMTQRLVSLALVGLLAGCAASAGPGGDPGARPLPPGYTCQSVRAELNKLDSQGVPSKGRGRDCRTQGVARRQGRS